MEERGSGRGTGAHDADTDGAVCDSRVDTAARRDDHAVDGSAHEAAARVRHDNELPAHKRCVDARARHETRERQQLGVAVVGAETPASMQTALQWLWQRGGGAHVRERGGEVRVLGGRAFGAPVGVHGRVPQRARRRQRLCGICYLCSTRAHNVQPHRLCGAGCWGALAPAPAFLLLWRVSHSKCFKTLQVVCAFASERGMNTVSEERWGDKSDKWDQGRCVFCGG